MFSADSYATLKTSHFSRHNYYKLIYMFSCLNSMHQLTDEEEKYERFAEEVAKMLGLAYYFQESCIAAKENQIDLLKKAYDIISSEMDTDPIQDEVCNETYKKKFVFYS